MKTPINAGALLGKREGKLPGRTRDILLATVALSALWTWNTCLLFLPVFHATPL